MLKLLSKLKHSQRFPTLRRWLNMLYYDSETVILHLSNFDTVAIDGYKFKASTQLDSLQPVRGNKWFEGILPGDVVLDVGANIGAITIPLADVAKKVFAVEPLYFQELQANITLNRLSNVRVFPLAIGDGDIETVEFAGRSSLVHLITFKRLLELLPPINFLKLDCEGAEWSIEPSLLEGIRQVRVEFHVRRTYKRRDRESLGQWLKWFNGAHYTVETQVLPVKVNPYYTEMVLLRAWLK